MSATIKDRLKETDLDVLFITNALGFCGDLEEIKNLCFDNDVILIEDNCESLGTETTSGRTGNFGLMSSFSFYVAHHMSTIEGGMVCSSNEDCIDMLKILELMDRIEISQENKKELREKYNIESQFRANYTFYDLGYNLRPTEITGFIGANQLKFVQGKFNSERKTFEN